MKAAHLRMVVTEPGPRDHWAPKPGATDEELVAALYERFSGLVFGIAMRYRRGDRTWAEDVTQDVFLGLFSRPAQLRAVESPEGWLYRITTNRCLTRLKRESRRRVLLSVHRGGRHEVPTLEHVQLESERLRRILAHVDAMPPEMRGCFYMHHVDARPQKEIARVLERSPSHVCRLLQRIDRDLRRLEAQEDAP